MKIDATTADITVLLRETKQRPGKSIADLLREAADMIDHLRIGQAVVAKQVGFYKPETPDFEFVKVPLGILRRALSCDPPPYPEDGIPADELAAHAEGAGD